MYIDIRNGRVGNFNIFSFRIREHFPVIVVDAGKTERRNKRIKYRQAEIRRGNHNSCQQRSSVFCPHDEHETVKNSSSRSKMLLVFETAILKESR